MSVGDTGTEEVKPLLCRRLENRPGVSYNTGQTSDPKVTLGQRSSRASALLGIEAIV